MFSIDEALGLIPGTKTFKSNHINKSFIKASAALPFADQSMHFPLVEKEGAHWSCVLWIGREGSPSDPGLCSPADFAAIDSPAPEFPSSRPSNAS